MSNLAKVSDLHLGALIISPSRGCIVVSGEEARIEPKVMEMLVALVVAKGQTLSRDDMIEQCWGGRIVSDDAITRVLGKVRQIGAMTDPHAFEVQTLPKIGSRLIISTGKTEPIVIVLPFDNLGGSAELDFFSDGVADEILGRLIRGSDLKVIGRTTSFQYRGERKAVAAHELRASHVVDGTLQRAGDRLRINVYLNVAESGAALWAQKFDFVADDIFTVQDEIAEQIANALDRAFSVPAKLSVPPAIYDLFLRTKSLANAFEQTQANIASLESVVNAVPHFADGWARLATSRAWHALQLPYHERPAQIAKAKYEIGRCRALDPENPETLYADFWLKPGLGAFEAKEAVVLKQLQANFNSSDANAMAVFHYFNVGRSRVALEHGRRAFELDPRDWSASICHAICHWLIGDQNEAIARFESHLIIWPDDHLLSAMLLVAYARAGLWEKVDALIDPKRLERFPLREHSGLVAVALTMRYPTQQNKDLLMSTLKRRVERSGAADTVIMFWACHLGLTDAVYDLAETIQFGPSGAKDDMLGVIAYRTVTLFLADFPELRNNPRFVPLCARFGLVEYWVNTGNWPDCADEVPYDFRAACYAALREPDGRHVQQDAVQAAVAS